MKKFLLLLAVLLVAIVSFIKPPLFFLILGTVSVGMGLFAISFVRKISRVGVYDVGTVVGYKSDDSGSATPIIKFTTANGDEIQATPHVFASMDMSSFANYNDPIARQVPILYDPDNAKKFVLRNEIGFNYIVFTAFILGGVLFIGVGISWLLGYIDLS
jgi:hypothetical protein